MSERNARGLGRFFGGEDSPEIGIGVSAPRDGEFQQTIAALRARVAELESSAGRPSFIDLDDDTLTQIAAEDAAVIIRAARTRSAKLVEQAMQEGAVCLSSGLEYVIGSYASTDEVVALARAAANTASSFCASR